MFALERLIIDVLLSLTNHEALNAFLRDPQTTAILVGGMIAVAGALLGSFLLLRGMSLTSDAISHTVLLGIVVAFLVMTGLFGQQPDLSSPWLIIGAAGAGVATVVLTEFIQRSGLVRQDAALGLAFPLLFALSIILISRFVEDVHLDEDSVMVGEIGVAWANTNSHCIDNCVSVTITPDDPQATVTRQCVNCRELGISPRDPAAEFRETCGNCGTYTPGQAWQAGLIDEEPVLVFWPKSITVTALMALLTVGFVTLFYKELKLAAFDAALAKALGLRPGLLHYALMVLVSLVAVGAFDAVGSILVIAFFIIPPAAAYLLTDRLALMLALSAGIGMAGAVTGYDLARGDFTLLRWAGGDVLGFSWAAGAISFPVESGIAFLNRILGLDLPEQWDSSISASMVLMLFFYFVAAWMLSPKYGLVSTLLRRANQRRRFRDQVLLGHIENHQHTPSAAGELALAHLHEHLRWPQGRTRRVLTRLRVAQMVQVHDGQVVLTPQGEAQVHAFRRRYLSSTASANG